MQVGFITGLRQEARLLQGRPVYVGGGTAAGAARAARQAVQDGMQALISFGLAGALAPNLRPGTLILPETILWNGRRFDADATLLHALGAPLSGTLLCWTGAAETAAHKAALHRQSGAGSIDLESGPVAEAAARLGLPFAVLRAICDDAATDLPWAATDALDAHGRIRFRQLATRLLRRPRELPAMIKLGKDAAKARATLAAAASSLAAPSLAVPPPAVASPALTGKA